MKFWTRFWMHEYFSASCISCSMDYSRAVSILSTSNNFIFNVDNHWPWPCDETTKNIWYINKNASDRWDYKKIVKPQLNCAVLDKGTLGMLIERYSSTYYLINFLCIKYYGFDIFIENAYAHIELCIYT